MRLGEWEYNVIVGRTTLAGIKAHLSPHMLLMKFPTCNGTGEIRGDQLSARTCYAIALKSVAFKSPRETLSVQGVPNGKGHIDDPRDEALTPHAQPAEELETVILNEDQPVPQKRCSYDVKRYEAMRTEVDKLQAIGFIREATYHVWLANSAIVQKVKGGWRMCQDYTDLNKACSKDSFLLPRINQFVDATAGHELFSFINAYLGYNQIFMHPADSEHMAFITDKGLYCYNVMPFGLKNVGATYQRLVNRILAKNTLVASWKCMSMICW